MDIAGVRIEVVKEMKLLGVIITDDLKWQVNTANITKKAYTRLWALRRLKKLVTINRRTGTIWLSV